MTAEPLPRPSHRAAARAAARLVRRRRRATCPGAPPDATPGGSSSPRSCSSRRRSPGCEPVWHEWLAALAGRRPTWPRRAPGDAVRAWGRLGYPRRALRLHAAAAAHRASGTAARCRHAEPSCWTCPASAPTPRRRWPASPSAGTPAVVDTNVRRVHGPRRRAGAPCRRRPPRPAPRRAGRRAAAAGPGRGRTWNVAVMELGALVCTARAPRCGDCPVGRPVRVAARRPAGVRRAGPPRAGLARHRPAVPRAPCCRAAAAPGPVTRGRAGRRLAHRRRPARALPRQPGGRRPGRAVAARTVPAAPLRGLPAGPRGRMGSMRRSRRAEPGSDEEGRRRAVRPAADRAVAEAGGAPSGAGRPEDGPGAGPGRPGGCPVGARLHLLQRRRRSGLGRLVELHSVHSAGDAALAVSLAGTRSSASRPARLAVRSPCSWC